MTKVPYCFTISSPRHPQYLRQATVINIYLSYIRNTTVSNTTLLLHLYTTATTATLIHHSYYCYSYYYHIYSHDTIPCYVHRMLPFPLNAHRQSALQNDGL